MDQDYRSSSIVYGLVVLTIVMCHHVTAQERDAELDRLRSQAAALQQQVGLDKGGGDNDDDDHHHHIIIISSSSSISNIIILLLLSLMMMIMMMIIIGDEPFCKLPSGADPGAGDGAGGGGEAAAPGRGTDPPRRHRRQPQVTDPVSTDGSRFKLVKI
jgi:hypothetical protein